MSENLPKLMTMSEFARLVGADLKSVKEGIANARIPHVIKGTRKMIQPERARAAWHGLDYDEETDSISNLKQVQELSHWKKQTEEFRSKKAKAEFEQMAGQLIDVEKVKNIAYETARNVRDGLMNIPDRVCHELAAETDPENVRRRLDDEIRKALEELSRDKFK